MYTFLITDIEASTRLWDSDPVAMSQAVAAHDQVVKRSIATVGGRVFATTGDGFAAVFPSPDHAIRAAIYIQITLTDGNLWPRHRKHRTGRHPGRWRHKTYTKEPPVDCKNVAGGRPSLEKGAISPSR